MNKPTDKEKRGASWVLFDEIGDIGALSEKIHHLAKRIQRPFQLVEPTDYWIDEHYKDLMYDTVILIDYTYELIKLFEKIDDLQNMGEESEAADNANS